MLELNSLEALPRALIKARIAAKLSQKDLAERLGLKEQQIQRYEATEYNSANLARVIEVSLALRIKFGYQRKARHLNGVRLIVGSPRRFKRTTVVDKLKE